ncbi:MAG: Nex18 symbiotically induced protein, partial [Phototrophicales bacterium]
MRKWVIFVLAALMAAFFALPVAAQERPTVAEILANDSDGRFTTLLAAVEAAGLTAALSGEGSFTVLAPT